MKTPISKFFPFFMAITLLLVIFAIVILSIMQTPTHPLPTTHSTPSPSVPLTPEIIPPNIKEIPTNIPERGGGVDISSPVIQDSINEIQKLYPSLPYSHDFTLTTGVTVSIIIPAKELQTTPWTLTAQIFGINYNVSTVEPQYSFTKKSFKEAANLVFLWVRQHNADPKKIIYTWGDRKYIQDQAERWLYLSN